MGVSRDTFYRVKEAKEAGGLEALLHKDRRRANLKNRVDEAIEQAVLAFALENPAAGQVRVSNELRQRGMIVSPTGVRSVWMRHGLQTFKLRLALLEKKAADEGLLLTETQIAALERKREEQAECGEIETAHPGYLGSQDTFYVGNMKGVGRIYVSADGTTCFRCLVVIAKLCAAAMGCRGRKMSDGNGATDRARTAGAGAFA